MFCLKKVGVRACWSAPAVWLTLLSTAYCADAYYSVSLSDDSAFQNPIPKPPESLWNTPLERRDAMRPRVVVDGEGEGYLDSESLTPQNQIVVPGERDVQWTLDRLLLRAPDGSDVTGSLYLPNSEWSQMERIRFRVPADAAQSDARSSFFRAKEGHYRRLSQQQIPGTAWYRRQARLARSEIEAGTQREDADAPGAGANQRPRRSDWEDTFQVFSGGRAVSENLQLDRLLPASEDDKPTVDIDSLEGITVAEIDWSTRTGQIEPQLDPLAAFVPDDQHALFFNSFDGSTRLIDEAKQQGTPVLDLIQPRVEDAQSHERYQKQMCLELDLLSRTFGRQVIGSVCITGSDPYLRTGTDVLVLLDTKSPSVVHAFVTAKQTAAAESSPGCQMVEGQVDGIDYSGAVSEDRSVCSYLAVVDDVVAVTNSLVQLKRLAAVRAGKTASLASLPEYRFFRDRYRRDSDRETALLVVTDATIRRWCGPKWRIATSRRTRAAAILADLQARNVDLLASGSVKPQLLHPEWTVTDLGTVRLTDQGVVSSTYGSLSFLTPISELDMLRVTEAEAQSYKNWRNGYQRYWRRFFDPIAVRFEVDETRLAADMTVMPLIAASDYNELIAITSGATIQPAAGDRHEGTLVHWALSINTKSRWFRQAESFLLATSQALRGGAFGWLGESIAVYVDDSPIWSELAQAEDKRKFRRERVHLLPIVARAEVKDSLKLALFLTAIRTAVEQSAPGLTTWETLQHNEQPYVKVSTTPETTDSLNVSDQFALYYAATPRSLMLTLNEDALKRALEREAARVASAKEGTQPSTAGKPWPGENMALLVDLKALGAFQGFLGDEYLRVMQARAWGPIPVLNEWKRRYPDHDPVKLQAKIWHAAPRCPGGGRYVWNADGQTMESTVYGSPFRPNSEARLPDSLENLQSIDFGVTFEQDGLRASVAAQRKPSR